MLDIVKFSLENFGLSMLILALVVSSFNFLIIRRQFFEILYSWVALLALGVTALYAFVMHAFFPDFTAGTIGWQNSPFQFEVAVANLGFGVIAILSFKASYGFRLATVIGNACWLWGDAIGHIYQMYVYHNFSIGNAGSWFWMDILVPLILILCINKVSLAHHP